MNGISNEDEFRKDLIRKLANDLPVLRARLGVSQADIAEKIGVSRQTYNSIETQKREMNWTIFVALVAIFQNNEKTKQLLDSLDNLSSDIEQGICL